jgi:regulator of sigma D
METGSVHKIGTSRQCEDAHAREIIEDLVQQRRRMMVLFCHAAGLDRCGMPAEADDPDEVLQAFCKALLAYLVYSETCFFDLPPERTPEAFKLIGLELQPQIKATSHIMEAFCEKYAGAEHTPLSEQLDEEMAHLGEALSARVGLEDQLARVLLLG